MCTIFIIVDFHVVRVIVENDQNNVTVYSFGQIKTGHPVDARRMDSIFREDD